MYTQKINEIVCILPVEQHFQTSAEVAEILYFDCWMSFDSFPTYRAIPPVCNLV